MIPKPSNDLLRAVNLLESDIDAAHAIAQQHEDDPVADTIHAIIHRRGGDYSNSIYWWRRVGEGVPAAILSVYPNNDPTGFVKTVQNSQLDAEKIKKVEQDEITALKSLFDGVQ